MIVLVYGSENKDRIKPLLDSSNREAERRGKRACNRVPMNFVTNTTAYWGKPATAYFTRDTTKPRHIDAVLQRNKE